MSIATLTDYRPVTRTPSQVGQERINDALAHIDNLNREGHLSGFLFIGLASTGSHFVGMAGEDNPNVLDMLALLELNRQTILLEFDHDTTRGEEPEQPDLFGEDM